MNSDPNSDSEQCTESKLGRVHRVHTPRTHCAQVVRTTQCRGAHWRCVVDVPGRVAGHVAYTRRRVVRAQRRVATRCFRVAALYHSLAAPYRDTKGCPQPRYNLLYRDSPHGQATRGPALSWPLLAVSWPYRGNVLSGLARLLLALCHDTVCCIVTQHKEKTHSSLHCTFFCFFFSLIFFFTHFFFHFVPPTGRPQKNILLFFFIFQ